MPSQDQTHPKFTLAELKERNKQFFALGYKGETYEYTQDPKDGQWVLVISVPFGPKPIYYPDSEGALHFKRY